MLFDNFSRRYLPTEDMVKNHKIAEYRQILDNLYRKPVITIDQVNQQIKKKRPDFPKVKNKFSKAERAKRAARTKRIRDFYAKQIINERMLSYKSYTGKRYPEEYMMAHDGEVTSDVRNKAIYEAFKNPTSHPEDLIRYHAELLEKFAAMDPLRLLSECQSDDVVVNRLDEIHMIARCVLEFPNMKPLLETVKDLDLDDEIRHKLDRCYEIIRKYEPYSAELSAFEKRMGFMHSPYYEQYDMDDPDLRPIITEAELDLDMGDIENPEKDVKLPDGSLDTPERFTSAVRDAQMYHESLTNAKERAAIRELLAQDCKKENLVFRYVKEDGTETEEKSILTESEALIIMVDLYGGKYPKAIIYDKTNREGTEKPITNNTSLADMYQRDLIEIADKPPVEPAVPDEPVRPVLQTTWWDRVKHVATLGRYKRSVYRQHEADKVKYKRDLARREKAILRHEAWAKVNDAFYKLHPGYDTLKEGHLVSDKVMNDTAELRTTEPGMKAIRDVFGFERQVREEWMSGRVYDADTAERMSANTHDVGDLNLDVLDPDHDELNLADEGIDNDMFAALAMAVALSPEIQNNRGGAPATAAFEDIARLAANNFAGVDLSRSLDTVIEPARAMVAECLKHFNTPLSADAPTTGKEKLAQLLSPAVTDASRRMLKMDWGERELGVMADALGKVIDFSRKKGINLTEELGCKNDAHEIIWAGQRAGRIYSEAKRAEYKLLEEHEYPLTRPMDIDRDAKKASDRFVPKKLTDKDRADAAGKVAMLKTLKEVSQKYLSNPETSGLTQNEGETDAAFGRRLNEDAQQRMTDDPDFIPGFVADLMGDSFALASLRDGLFPRGDMENLTKGGSTEWYEKLVKRDMASDNEAMKSLYEQIAAHQKRGSLLRQNDDIIAEYPEDNILKPLEEDVKPASVNVNENMNRVPADGYERILNDEMPADVHEETREENLLKKDEPEKEESKKEEPKKEEPKKEEPKKDAPKNTVKPEEISKQYITVLESKVPTVVSDTTRENVRRIVDRGIQSQNMITAFVSGRYPFVRSEDVTNVVVYNEVKRICESEQPDPDKTALLGREDADEVFTLAAKATDGVNYFMNRRHSPSVIKDNLLEQEGLDNLTDLFGQTLDTMIERIKAEMEKEKNGPKNDEKSVQAEEPQLLNEDDFNKAFLGDEEDWGSVMNKH